MSTRARNEHESTKARNEHEMSTQLWYENPIVGFQTLEPYTLYKLECLVTLILYKKGKNKTQKNYFARIFRKNNKKEICDKKQIWLAEKNVEKILEDHHIFIANEYDGYENNLSIIPILSIPIESQKTFELEEHKIEVA